MPRHPKVSASTHGLTSRVYSALVPRIKAYQGETFPLHVGDTWREPPPYARAETLRTADHPLVHTYPPPHGMPEMVQAVQAKLERRYGVQREPAEIQIMPGATGALNAIIAALCDPGDEVIIPAPFWPLIRGQVAAHGAVPVQVSAYVRPPSGQVKGEGEDGPLDVAAAIEAAVTERTVAIYLNTPNNPSGVTLSSSQLDDVAAVAKRHDLWVWTDEVYEDLYLGAEPPPPPLWTRPDMFDRTIATHSMSKAYALSGERVGYSHGPAEAMAVIRGMQTFLTYCAPRSAQVLAAAALNRGDDYLEETRQAYRDQAKLAASALDLPMPSGGTFFYFDAAPYLQGATDSSRDGVSDTAMPLLLRSVDEAGVILVPGEATGAAYKRFVRLCFTSVGPDALSRALDGLAKVMRS